MTPLIFQIILITGFINVVAVLFLFLTCRIIPSFNQTRSLMQKNWYKSIYKYHPYIWWVLIFSVIIHVAMVVRLLLARH
jgi:hypothetical protein